MTTADERAYRAALAALLALPDYERGTGRASGGVPFNLDRPRALLRALDNPQLARPTILIAGSKGKGSTAALIESILRAHGLRTLLYTQPHLNDYRERVRLDGRLIDPGMFARCAERVADAAQRLQRERPDLGLATTYEQTTALAFLAAREQQVDWAVVEVGLGGRLDATNLSDPLVSVITPIGLEHRAILGDTLAAIAGEKAAILRPARPAVAASQTEEALAVIRARAAALGARLVVAPDASSAAVQAVASVLHVGASEMPRAAWHLSVQMPWRRYQDLALPLPGAFQVGNLCTALYTVEALPGADEWLDPVAVRRGVAAVRWPGRVEVARTPPLVVLDGAHTVESAQELARALRLHFRWRALTTIFACLEDKDAAGMLQVLAPLSDRLVLTTTHHPRARPAQELRRIAAQLGLEAETAASVAAALDRALASAAGDDAICVSGSLSAVGEARACLGLPVE